MKKENNLKKEIFIIFALTLILAAGCKKTEIFEPDYSIGQEIDKIKETAKNTLLNNDTATQDNQELQTIYVYQDNGEDEKIKTISANYQSSCLVKKYKGLNIWCSFKNMWHNQSELISWYIPYSIMSFFALALAIVIIWNLLKRR